MFDLNISREFGQLLLSNLLLNLEFYKNRGYSITIFSGFINSIGVESESRFRFRNAAAFHPNKYMCSANNDLDLQVSLCFLGLDLSLYLSRLSD